MTKIDFNSIKYKFFIYFAVFSLLIIALFCVCQYIYVTYFYVTLRKNVMIDISEELFTTFKKGDYEEFYVDTVFNNKMNAVIFVLTDDGYEVVFNAEEQVNNFTSVPDASFYDGFFEKLSTIDYDKIINYEVDLDSSSRNYSITIFGAKTIIDGQTYYFYMSSPIINNDSAFVIMQSQYLPIGIIIILVGLVISLMLARMVSKPIEKMSDKASQLSKRNFDIRFSEEGCSEIVNLAKGLNRSCEELEKSEKLQKYMIANVSHDLKTPLTMIKGYAEMSEEMLNNKSPKIAEYMEIIVKESDRLTGLINDMLSMSKMESGNEVFNLEKLSASEICHGVAFVFKEYCSNLKMTLKTEIEEELFVIADKIKLQQVLYNFLANAMNYSQEGSEILLSLKKIDGVIKFSVKDSGVGINEEEIDCIWDKYYKSHLNDKMKMSSGLGLYICKNIFNYLNANYGVKSVYGKGSTFYFTLLEA